MKSINFTNCKNTYSYISLSSLSTCTMSIPLFLLLILFIAISTIFLLMSLDLIVNGPHLLLLSNNTEVYNTNTIDNNLKMKTSIFNPIIDLFHKSASKYRYFPSCFVSGKFNTCVFSLESQHINSTILDKTSLVDSINYKSAYLMVEYHNSTYRTLFTDLYKIISDYTPTTK